MDLLEYNYYENLISKYYTEAEKEGNRRTAAAAQERTLFGAANAEAEGTERHPEQQEDSLFMEKLKSDYLEPVFHHYLPKQRQQQGFKFYTKSGAVDYVAERYEEGESKQRGAALAAYKAKDNAQLLDIDVAQMLKELEITRQEEKTEKMQELEQDYARQIAAHNAEMRGEAPEPILEERQPEEGTDSQVSGQPDSETAAMLWVDKYTSVRFFDLLTDEALNRNVLTWLKSWDGVVFPERAQVSLKLPDSVTQQPGQFKRDLTFRKVDATGTVYYQTADVEFSHQNKKLITLYGPPGTGKSTMARVLAKQCGYEARIINASDKRSPADLIDAMKNALTQNAHFGNGPEKPVCLIVDEVDGAVNGGIGQGFNKVVEFLKRCMQSQGAKTKTEDDDFEIEDDEGNDGHRKLTKTKGKKKDDDFALQRPIIFICNDLYTKALRPLREISLQVKIPESDPQRLIQRLRHIASKEGIKIDDTILKDLANQCSFDARSSINSLQFLAKKFKNQRITLNDLSKSNLYNQKDGGLKDQFTNIFSVTEKVLFEKPTHLFGTQLLREIKADTSALGDYQLLNNCLFENYSSCAHYFDDSMEKTAFFLDTLSRCEIQQQFVYKTQHHAMAYQYQFMPAMMFKKYCANQQKTQTQYFKDGNSSQKPVRVQYPQVFRSMKAEEAQNKAIFEQLMDLGRKQSGMYEKVTKNGTVSKEQKAPERFKLGQNSSIQACLRKKDFLLDILPSIYIMIHPEVREINIQLFNQQEKDIFLKAIEFMVLFDIKLKPKSEDSSIQAGGEPIYRLPTGANQNNFSDKSYIPSFEPDIGHVCTFGTKQAYSAQRVSGGHQKQFMRLKTQILVTQNYEKVKQAMLADQDTGAAIFVSKLNELKKQQAEDRGGGRTLKSFMSNLQNQGYDERGNAGGKKRNIDDISAQDPSQGRFRFKFQEGHSKNFKRELAFDWFLTPACK